MAARSVRSWSVPPNAEAVTVLSSVCERPARRQPGRLRSFSRLRPRSGARSVSKRDLACSAPTEVGDVFRPAGKCPSCRRPRRGPLCSAATAPCRGAPWSRGQGCGRQLRIRLHRRRGVAGSARPGDPGGHRRRRVHVPGRPRSWRSEGRHCDPAHRARRHARPDEAPAGTTCRQRRATIGSPGGPRSSHSSLSRYVAVRP